MTAPRLAKIVWDDPWASGGWTELDEALAMADDPARGVCETVGWIIKETDDYIVVVGSLGLSFDGNRQVGDVFKCPRSCIREIVGLHLGRLVHGDNDRADGFA